MTDGLVLFGDPSDDEPGAEPGRVDRDGADGVNSGDADRQHRPAVDLGDLSLLDANPPEVRLGRGDGSSPWTAPPAVQQIVDPFEEPFDVDDFLLEPPEDIDEFFDADSGLARLGEASSPPPPRRHLVISDFDDEPDVPVVAGVPRVSGPRPPAAPTGSVVIDATDEPPDAIVIGSAQREGGNLVFSDDDDPIEIVLPDDTRAAKKPRKRMDPRVRSRRISVKRAAGRRRLKLVLLIGVPLLLVAGALAVLASPLFSVERIDIVGARYTSAEEIEPVLAELRGEPVLTIDTQRAERLLATLPWVRRVSVDAQFPDRVLVTLVERVPAAAYVGQDLMWRVIDVDGAVIAVIPDGAQPADFLPILGAGPNISAGQSSGPTYLTLAQLAATLDALPTLRPMVVSMAVSGPDISLVLTTGATINLGGANDMRAKLAVLLTLLSDPDRELEEISAINVSDPTKPAIQ